VARRGKREKKETKAPTDSRGYRITQIREEVKRKG
jgi:hypothetical protein